MFLFKLLWLIPVIIFLLIALKNKTLRTEAGYLLIWVVFTAIVSFIIMEFCIIFISSFVAFFDDDMKAKYVIEMMKDLAIFGLAGGGIVGLIIYPTMSVDDMLEYKPK